MDSNNRFRLFSHISDFARQNMFESFDEFCDFEVYMSASTWVTRPIR